MIISWIDDRSRKCLGFGFLLNKCSIKINTALKEILMVYPLPYAIWTDNGSEFQEDFDKLLHKWQIIQKTITPYNPQQNGKCEKLGPAIEMAQHSKASLRWLPSIMKPCIVGCPKSYVKEDRVVWLQMKSGMREINTENQRFTQSGQWMVLHTHFHQQKPKNQLPWDGRWFRSVEDIWPTFSMACPFSQVPAIAARSSFRVLSPTIS
jgi:hypothetical protein